MIEAAKLLAKAIDRLGTNDAATAMGAIEFHALEIKNAAEKIAAAIYDLAEAIRDSRTPSP